MEFWGLAQDNVSDADMKARIIGVQTKMQTFSFLYGLQLAMMLKRIPSYEVGVMSTFTSTSPHKCHQGILRVMLDPSTIPRGLLPSDLL